MSKKIILYTTATPSYDGFGTQTIAETEYTSSNDKPIRKVEVEESAYNWQTNRYYSGNNMVMTEDEFEKWTKEYPNGILKKKIQETKPTATTQAMEQSKSMAPPTAAEEEASNKYVPISQTCYSVDTVVPHSMRYELHKAIETVDRRVNGVDEFVAEKLGYIQGNCSMEQRKHGLKCLCDAFSAEQVDAIAMAIYNIEQKGQSAIIADQTGIGKGRIAAGMIRYAVNRGLKPIFITEKVNLFSDIFRDIINIGSDDGIPIEILEGYKEVEKKAVKVKSEDEDDVEEESDDDEEELEVIQQAVYKKNKAYPSYTYTEVDEEGKEHIKTKTGKQFMRPFIVNGSGSGDKKTEIKDEQGNILYKGSSAEVTRIIGMEKKKIKGTFNIPEEYDFVISTYSQFRGMSAKAKTNPTAEIVIGELPLKMQYLYSIASGNIVIMDESHNASGASNVGKFLKEVLARTIGVTFLSATFAKRPDNMPIYGSKTAMADANMSSEQLVAAITNGGVALQEIVSSALVSEGQMIRRERSFEGIETNYEYLDKSQTLRGYPNLDLEAKHKAAMDAATDIIRDIMEFQKQFVDEIIDLMDREVKEKYSEISQGKQISNAGIDNQPIFSGVFNIINQLLFSIKAEAVAEVAIQRLKEGKKPVIAFANTMESFLNSIKTDSGEQVSEGDVVNSDFALIFRKRLDSILKYTYTDIDGVKTTHYLDPYQQSPEFVSEYTRILNKINTVSIGICSSPIDVVVQRINDAGFTTVEVTGRSRQLKLLENGSAQIKNRNKINASDAFRKFNNNEVDCLLINQSGSTGASAHAVPTKRVPKDKVKQRVMIILQAELNVNTEVQKRGRINRTGQILKPIYDYVISAIPAEKRLMMMLQKKLKSLLANTTAAQKAQNEENEGSVDFLNKYGDKIVYEYLAENPEINKLLGDPLNITLSSEEEPFIKPDSAHKVSGRVAILKTEDQEKFYHEVGERYTALIDYLNQVGDNDLHVVPMKLDAETLERDIVVVGKGGNSVFARNSVLEKCRVNNLKKPYSKKEVDNLIKEGLGGMEAEIQKELLIEKYVKFTNTNYENDVREINAFYDSLISNITNEKKYIETDYKNEYAVQRKAFLNEARENKLAAEKEYYANKSRIVLGLLNYFHVGKVVSYPSQNYKSDGKTYKAIFAGFSFNENSRNPFAPSAIKLRFAIASSMRYVAVPASKLDIIDAIKAATSQEISYYDQQNTLDMWDEIISEKSADKAIRYIVTGNILQAFSNPELRGSLISYSTIEGGFKKGILLPETYSKLDAGRGGRQQATKVPVLKALPVIKSMSNNSTVILEDSLSIQRQWSDFALYVPVSKNLGGKYYLDEKLRNLAYGGTFNKTGSQMIAKFEITQIDEVVEHLQKMFNQSALLSPSQFLIIADSIEDVEYEDEVRKPEPEQFVDRLSEEDQKEAERRASEGQTSGAGEELPPVGGDVSEPNKLLAAQNKMLQLMQYLGDEKFATGGIIQENYMKAREIGASAYKKGKTMSPMANAEFTALLSTVPVDVHNDFNINALSMEFIHGYEKARKEELRAKYPQFYKQ